MNAVPSRINYRWVEEFLAEANWNIDADHHPLNRLNMNNGSSRIKLVEEYLRPAYVKYSPAQRRAVRESFRFMLSFADEHTFKYYTMHVLPDVTSDVRTFLVHLWTLLFPGDDWLLESDEGYQLELDTTTSLHDSILRFGRW